MVLIYQIRKAETSSKFLQDVVLTFKQLERKNESQRSIIEIYNNWMKQYSIVINVLGINVSSIFIRGFFITSEAGVI